MDEEGAYLSDRKHALEVTSRALQRITLLHLAACRRRWSVDARRLGLSQGRGLVGLLIPIVDEPRLLILHRGPRVLVDRRHRRGPRPWPRRLPTPPPCQALGTSERTRRCELGRHLERGELDGRRTDRASRHGRGGTGDAEERAHAAEEVEVSGPDHRWRRGRQRRGYKAPRGLRPLILKNIEIKKLVCCFLLDGGR